MASGAAGKFSLLNKDGIGPSALSQVVKNTTSSDSTANDNDSCLLYQCSTPVYYLRSMLKNLDDLVGISIKGKQAHSGSESHDPEVLHGVFLHRASPM